MKDIGINLWGEKLNKTEIEKFERISGVGKVGKFSPSHSLDAAMCVVMPTIGMGMKAEIHAALTREAGIMLVSIDDFRGKTRDEVKELVGWGALVEKHLHPEIEEERGIFISRLIDATNEQFVEKVVGTRGHVGVNPKDLANQIQEIIEFQIKSREYEFKEMQIFENETKSTKNFIQKLNQQYARKKWRK